MHGFECEPQAADLLIELSWDGTHERQIYSEIQEMGSRT